MSGRSEVNKVTKVSRYRAGKLPEYAKDEGGDDSLFERRPQKQHTSDPSFAPEGSVAHVRAAQRLKSLSIRKRDSGKEDTDDLGRRKREPVESDDDEDLGSAPSRHVEAAVVLKASIQPAKVIRRDRPPQKTTQEEEEEEDEFEARRRRARQVDSDEEELLDREEEASSDEDEGSSSDDSSDYDSSDEDQLLPPRLLVQPVFVKKDMRETVAERERLEKQLEEEQKMEEVRAEERKRESKKLAEQVVVKEFEETVKEAAKPEEDIDKDIDEQAEYEAWKQRELARIKREKENRTARVKEIEETQRRRNLSDAQIRAENPERFYKEKKEMKFLQKYYHKGAFYQDDPVIQKRNWTEATGDDQVDKSILPKVMQVKNFGRKGRTKYTHLADQDTSSKEAMWAEDERLRMKYQQKLAGVGDLERPTKRKRSDR